MTLPSFRLLDVYSKLPFLHSIDSAKDWSNSAKLTSSLSVTTHEPTGAVNTYSITLSQFASYFGMASSFSRYSGGVILSIALGVSYYDIEKTATPSPNPESLNSAVSSTIEYIGGSFYAWTTSLFSFAVDLAVGPVKATWSSVMVGLQGGIAVGAFTYTVLHDDLGLDSAIATIIAIPAGVIGGVLLAIGAAVVYGLALLMTLFLRLLSLLF